MKKLWLSTVIAVAFSGGMLGARVLQEGGPPPAAPGAQHEVLKSAEGEWNADIKMFMGPGAPPSESKGTESIRMEHGGLWQFGQFKGEIMGQAFSGTSLATFDSKKQKYVSAWVDSMTDSITMLEGTFDPKTKTFTYTTQGPNMAGEVVTFKHTTVLKDKDTRNFTIAEVGKDGKENVTLAINYTRKK